MLYVQEPEKCFLAHPLYRGMADVKPLHGLLCLGTTLS